MITLDEFSAWIVVDGRPLKEYLVAVDQVARKVSCWIPSKAGKSFSVHWRDHGSQIHSCAFISLDGFLVPGRFLFGHGDASREGVRTSSNTERPFVFAEHINRRDCCISTASAGQINPDAGTIGLKIRRVTIDSSRPADEPQNPPEVPASPNSMLSQCISYGEERRTYDQLPETWQVKPYDASGNRSYVTFLFRYRSREFLLGQGIIPVDDIPPEVEEACAMNRRVVSVPYPAGGSTFLTPSTTPSSQIKDDSDSIASTHQPSSVPVADRLRGSVPQKPASTNTSRYRGPYPGEGILDLSFVG